MICSVIQWPTGDGLCAVIPKAAAQGEDLDGFVGEVNLDAVTVVTPPDLYRGGRDKETAPSCGGCWGLVVGSAWQGACHGLPFVPEEMKG